MESKKRKAVVGILNTLLPVLAAFLVGAVVILLIGENPLVTYWILVKNSLFSGTGFLTTLHYAGPLILTGLAIAVTFKANVYNMGVEGQMLVGAFFTGIAGAYITGMNPFLHKAVCIVIGIICGMVFAFIPAIIKVKCKANEMVVTLMLNYAVLKVLEFLSTGVFRDESSGYVATKTIQESAMFSRFGVSRLTMFFGVVVLALIGMYILMKKSKLGFEITAIGKSTEFAEATGMKVGRKIIMIMLISGGLSGLAGAGYMMSDQFKFTLGFSGNPGLGWDGMLIALLGGHSPMGVLVAAIFYAALKTGSDNINLYTNVPKEIVAMIQGFLILFLSIKFIHSHLPLLKKLKSSK
jgi:ABC-type uncharacterized transport system permease subunit